jgi:hypothetical protein
MTMPMVPANAITRELTWKDFPEDYRTEPLPEEDSVAAETVVSVNDDHQWIEDSKGFKLVAEPTVRVGFPGESWVASYVSKWSKEQRDALLGHEQTHYLIGVLSARDELNELRKTAKKTYKTQEALQADLDKAEGLGSFQDINEKYDADTEHHPLEKKEEQARWSKAVREAVNQQVPLRTYLHTKGLI